MVLGENRQPHELIGLQLGKCMLERPLGVGGMGAVYLAQQLRPRRQVAVKVLQRSPAMDQQAWETFLARFRREADAAAALDHANIVPIYEFGEDGDLAYLVMPYLADGSLADLLASEGTLPVKHAVAYVEQTAAALDHAHAHGIVHRDVKPSNLLLHPDGRLLLTDFGIARPLDGSDLTVPASSRFSPSGGDTSLTQHGVVMGTPEFMAPEQIARGPVTTATDIYALGIVAYAMLVGQTPFVDDTSAAVLARQMREPPTPIRTLRPDVPASIEEAVFWALAKSPEDRPGSAGELAQAMRGTSRTQGLGTLIGWHAAARQRTSEVGATKISQRQPAVQSESRPPDVPPSPTDSTFTGGRYLGGFAGGDGGSSDAPVWPGMQRTHPTSSRQQLPLIAFLTVGGLAALILVIVLASALTGDLLAISNQGTPGANGAAHGTVTMTPQVTTTPKPSPTPRIVVTNWLGVNGHSISLGCKGHTQTQTIVLSNNGPERVGWHAEVQTSFGAPRVSVSPSDGELAPGDSQEISVTNRTFLVSQTGTITFQPDESDAGEAQSVSYKAQGCR
ncbi:MAG TPA: serine/threonine-protein kinase [Ktedonobacterales bacterium]|nr:serine/threonine-protein kinase [Ktedonobacterales bacterium]